MPKGFRVIGHRQLFVVIFRLLDFVSCCKLATFVFEVTGSNRTMLELKYVIGKGIAEGVLCSNRTMLELKYFDNLGIPVSKASSNRTMLELKFTLNVPILYIANCSNRTMLELKF